jgi:hypothetical protein
MQPKHFRPTHVVDCLIDGGIDAIFPPRWRST